VSEERARVVIVGGGVAGTSIAYHLTKLGWTDVVLVDRSELTSGSTFHSAGLVAQLRNSVSHTRMMMYGVDLYPRLKEETGVDPGWHQVGTLHLATSAYRLEALARMAGWAESFGLPIEIVSASQAHERFPLIESKDVLGAAFVPTDGHVDPSGLTFAFAEGAKSRGARMRPGVRVVEIPVDHGRVTGVVIRVRRLANPNSGSTATVRAGSRPCSRAALVASWPSGATMQTDAFLSFELGIIW